MMKELLQRGFYVVNQPQERDIAESTSADAASAATALTSPSPPANSSDPSPSTSADEGMSDPTRQRNPPQGNKSVKLKMDTAGLYEKFPESTVLLRDFQKHLTESLKISNCQREVNNVSRFLRYVQPTGDEPTLEFLKTFRETRDYFLKLEKTGMTPATILKYMANIIRFLDFLKFIPKFKETDSGHRERCQHFKEFLQSLREPDSMSHSQKTVEKRWGGLVGGIKSVSQCQEVLQVAKPDFLDIFGRLITHQPINDSQKTMYRYYLEAIIVLQNFQRPRVAEKMTVNEYVNRMNHNGHVIISIKTATQQVAMLCLTMEEEAWFDTYYRNIRPANERSHCEAFFIGRTGGKLNKVTDDIRRLQEMYSVDPSTSQEARRAAEAEIEAEELFTPRQTVIVARNLAHTTKVAESHYWMQTPPDQINETAELLSIVNKDADEHSAGTSQPEKVSSFLKTFSMSIDGSAPPAKKRKEAGFKTQK